MPRKALEIPLSDQAHRLREARAARGFADAAAVSAFFGWNYTTYSQHERGERGLARAADRYAKALRVSAGWLLTGEGVRDSNRVAVSGRIGASVRVTMDDRDAETADRGWLDFPNPADCWAFVVEDDSLRPRFYAGEIVAFALSAAETDAEREELLGQYCLVQIEKTGDWCVGVLRKSRSADAWRLESYSADPIEDVALKAVYPWEATFRPRAGRNALVAGSVSAASHARRR